MQYSPKLKKAMEEYASIVNERKDNVNDWISVEDELPKDGGRYWCYVEEINDLGISHFQWNCSYHETEKRFSDRYLTNGEKITHWMPLPKPPIQ